MGRKVYKECGSGWDALIDPLIAYCQEHGFEIAQIKEKFGQLRFYTYSQDATLDKMIAEAEQTSAHTCEVCGEAGTLRIGGWLRVLCDKHHEERERAKSE